MIAILQSYVLGHCLLLSSSTTTVTMDRLFDVIDLYPRLFYLRDLLWTSNRIDINGSCYHSLGISASREKQIR